MEDLKVAYEVKRDDVEGRAAEINCPLYSGSRLVDLSACSKVSVCNTIVCNTSP